MIYPRVSLISCRSGLLPIANLRCIKLALTGRYHGRGEKLHRRQPSRGVGRLVTYLRHEIVLLAPTILDGLDDFIGISSTIDLNIFQKRTDWKAILCKSAGIFELSPVCM